MQTKLKHIEYKETEPKSLPKDWKVVRLGDVVDLTMGQSPPGNTYNEKGDGMPFLQGKAEFGSLHPTHAKYTIKPLKKAPEGSVLLSVRAPVGDVNIANIDYCIGRGLASLSLIKGSNIFLFYLLSHFKSEIESEGTGSTFKAINKSKIDQFKVPLPPFAEQKKIAYILSTIREAKEKGEQVINTLKELRKSLMKHLFTYGPVSLEETEKVKSKDTEIGKIPKEWDVLKLGDVVIPKGGLKRGPWGGSIKKEIFVPEGFKIYEQQNVIRNNFEIGSYFIDENKFNELIGFEVKAGDILITAAGTLGKIAIVPNGIKRGIINQALLRIRLDGKKILTSYFRYLFTHLVDNKVIEGYSHGATLRNLSSIRILGNIKIPLPSFTTQQEIASILSSVDEKMDKEENKKRALEGLFKSMLQSLMTAKIRVKDWIFENE